jgi:C-terminal processing protease CtpA/Prc
MRYFIANDHLDPVREFLGGEFLHQCLARREVDLIPVAQFLGCVADPSPLRERINEQVRRCLASDDPTLVANTLRLLAGVEGARAGAFKVPGIADRIRPLLGSPHFAVSTQAQRALLRINPRDLTPGTVRAPLANVALLYHQDPEVRTAAIRALAGGRDPGIIDDLIRACSVETYRFVRNAYDEVLTAWIGPRPRSPWAWKAWLQSQVAAGKVTIDYQPIVVADLDPNQRAHLDPLALRLGPEHFAHFAGVIRRKRAPEAELRNALRYMVANDHLPQVREFLGSEWLGPCLARKDADISILLFLFHSWTDPDPLRARLHDQVRRCLQADDPMVLANTLHLLAGFDGGLPGLDISGVEERVHALVASPHPTVAAQARRAANPRRLEVPDMSRRAGREDAPAANRGDSGVSYAEALRDLHAALGRQYPCFELKGIDWEAVGRELLPRVESVKTDEEFGLLCLELVARLQDSHALLMKGSADVPQPAFPVWDGGFACLDDDQGRAVVYFLVPEGPAAQAGLTLGQIVTHVNDQPAATAIEKAMRLYRTYAGYSSQRYLRYHALRFFARQDTQNAPISLSLVDTQGKQRRCQMRASLKAGYVPRLPVPIPGIEDAGSVSWKRLDDEIGYIYVRRVGGDLIEKLDQAVGEFQTARGLIIDVRGNSGGGFDSDRAHRNFFLDEVGAEPNRPRFRGPLALLVDERCISAGEGWASWFIARQRARVFGQTTAGASSRKIEYTLKNGLYRVSLPVKAYTGYLNRPIEFRGLEPDVPVRPKAEDLARGRDTVLLAAQSYLLTQPSKP